MKLNNADTTKEMVVPKGAEGWGRLKLFEASNSYGAFATDVTVDMDADNGFDLLKSTSLTTQFDEMWSMHRRILMEALYTQTMVKTADTANTWTGLLLMASSAATAAGIGTKRLNKNKNKQ